MKKLVITAVLLAFLILIAGLIKHGDGRKGGEQPVPQLSAVELFERDLAKSGKVLIEFAPLQLARSDVLMRYRYTPEQLAKTPLYIKPQSDGSKFLCVTGEQGSFPVPPQYKAAVIGSAEVIRTKEESQLLADGKLLESNLDDVRLFWIADGTVQGVVISEPEAEVETVGNVTALDGFMRKKLAGGDWTVSSGSWKMKQYGGGMPETEAQMESYSFQRAVNPFSVVGEGILTYGTVNMAHHLGEASIYFGKPWRAGAVDQNSLPRHRIFIAQGKPDGALVGFGWDGVLKRYVLVMRDGADGELEVLAEKDALRPPISNWVKLGLQVRSGYIVEGLIDGQVTLTHNLKSPVNGPFHIVSLGGNVEFDDFSIHPTDGRREALQPIYVRSKNFAGKNEKKRSDPEEFGEWARGEGTYLKAMSVSEDEKFKFAVMLSRRPLMADFEYQSVPESDAAGAFPPGVYKIELLKNPSLGLPQYSEMTPIFTKQLVYDGVGWSAGDGLGVDEGEAPVHVVKLRRTKANGNVVELMTTGEYKPVSEAVDGPVHFAISRVLPRIALLKYPNPEHHQVLAANVVNEFFEGAPVNWNWIDGSFRMDSRWACQNQWNFMACGSRGVPMLVSKRSFSGYQEHEYFMSLRPMLPSDAGDPSFTFSMRLHRELLQQFGGWYNRHDFNFSFCMDGRNPLSGYTVVFGGENNEETRLLRKGEVVARTTDALFPKSVKILDVHWEWWHFAVRKYDNRVIVLYKNKPLFDYVDSDPIDGGHIAFWTVRNGFTISKVSSTAQTVTWQPDVLHIPEDEVEAGWFPLVKDSVYVSKGENDMVVVTANVGAGSMGARYRFKPPVILQRKPNLKLPLDIGPGTMVNVYLQIDDKSFVIEVNAPLSGCKGLLTPEYEPDYNIFITDRPGVRAEMKRNEFFQVKEIPESTIRSTNLLASSAPGRLISINLWEALQERGYTGIGLLRSITIGNASNTDYLQAGGRANNAGAYYSVGVPVFSE